MAEGEETGGILGQEGVEGGDEGIIQVHVFLLVVASI